MKKVETNMAPEAVGPYSQAVEVSGWVFTSGQIPLTQDGELVGETIQEQTEQVLKNIAAILAEAGTSLKNVVKTTIFLRDMNYFAEVNEIYQRYFAEHKPARSCVEVSRLPKDVLVEMEVIAKKE